MCVACSEFIKETLTLKEFQSALWEATREDEPHLEEVERLMSSTENTPEKLRETLRNANKSTLRG